MLGRVKTFFTEVLVEGKKVDWPSRQQTIRFTAVVISISIAVAAFLGILDFLFVKILGKFVWQSLRG